MKRQYRLLLGIGVICAGLVIGPIYNAFGLEISGQVYKKRLITGMAISTKVKAILKVYFHAWNVRRDQTVALCAGDMQDFEAADCPMVLSAISPDDNPAYQDLLSILDTTQISGKQIYIISSDPLDNPNYSIKIE